MDKHPQELSNYEEIRRSIRIMRIFEIITGGLIGVAFLGIPAVIMIMLNILSDRADILEILLSAAVVLFIVGFAIYRYKTIDRQLEKMKSFMGISSDEEMEALIGNSHMIDEMIYISEQYLIDFSNCKVCRLSDIKLAKSYDTSSDSGTHHYWIRIKLNGGKNSYLKFDTEYSRDKAYKAIEAAAGFAEGQKYID